MGTEFTRAEAGEELASLLLHFRQKGRLSAKEDCCISWWASRSGPEGPVQGLAFFPWTKSIGHYQRHMDAVLSSGEGQDGHYMVDVPRFLVHSAIRHAKPLPIHPPHECLHEEAMALPSLRDKLLAQEGGLPPTFRARPAAQGSEPGSIAP